MLTKVGPLFVPFSLPDTPTKIIISNLYKIIEINSEIALVEAAIKYLVWNNYDGIDNLFVLPTCLGPEIKAILFRAKANVSISCNTFRLCTTYLTISDET